MRILFYALRRAPVLFGMALPILQVVYFVCLFATPGLLPEHNVVGIAIANLVCAALLIEYYKWSYGIFWSTLKLNHAAKRIDIFDGRPAGASKQTYYLYLRSFGRAARPSHLVRLVYIMILGASSGLAIYSSLASNQISPYIANAALGCALCLTPLFIPWIISRFPHDSVEAVLAKWIDGKGPLIAIGERERTLGAFKIYRVGDAWKETFERLARSSETIYVKLSASPGLLWEISQILKDEQLLVKTYWIDFGGSDQLFHSAVEGQDRAAVSDLFKDRGFILPERDLNGRLFKLRATDGRLDVGAPLIDGESLRHPKSKLIRLLGLTFLGAALGLAGTATGVSPLIYNELKEIATGERARRNHDETYKVEESVLTCLGVRSRSRSSGFEYWQPADPHNRLEACVFALNGPWTDYSSKYREQILLRVADFGHSLGSYPVAILALSELIDRGNVLGHVLWNYRVLRAQSLVSIGRLNDAEMDLNAIGWVDTAKWEDGRIDRRIISEAAVRVLVRCAFYLRGQISERRSEFLAASKYYQEALSFPNSEQSVVSCTISDEAVSDALERISRSSK